MALAAQAYAPPGRLDRITLCLSVILFVSPWAMNYADLSIAAKTAWISAVVIALFSAAATWHLREWEEWINLFAGAWLVVAPWVLNFHQRGDANSSFIAIGMLTFAISLSEIVALHEKRGAGDRAKV